MSLILRRRARRPRRFALLDRDGVLNRDTGYAHDPGKLELVPGARALCRRLRRGGYALVVVTNQSGLARGLFDGTAYRDFMAALETALGERFDLALPCPHLATGKVAQFRRWCPCRKPRPGLISRALRRYGGRRDQSLLIGDSLRDIAAARQAGVDHALLYAPDDGMRRRLLPRGVRRLRRLGDFHA